MGWFGTSPCDACGEKTLKSRLTDYETPEGPIALCSGCLEIQTTRDRRIEDHRLAWNRVLAEGGSLLIEGAATVDATWQDLPQDMITLDQVRDLLEQLPVTDPGGARLSSRPFALASARRPLRFVDLFEQDPDFLSQILDAYSLEDMVDEAAGVLLSFLYEKAVAVQYIGDVELMYKAFVHEKEEGRIVVSAHYILAVGSKVSAAAGGIERPIKRMVIFRAGENRFVWCKFVDRD
jgi:hypothetical protein